jgi:hypothetical protein
MLWLVSWVCGARGCVADWAARQQSLASLLNCRIFLVNGAPRSGTTWLQTLLDCHPQVSCRGEGLFQQKLAAPLDALMRDRGTALAEKNATVFVTTYEQLSASPQPVVRGLFDFLGVATDDDIIAACVARRRFAVLSGGRRPGMIEDGAFYRAGIVGGWRDTFTEEMNQVLLAELVWSFPRFGWTP